MGGLTGDMSRLVSEIGSLRNTHKAFIANVKQNVADMKSEVARMRSDFYNSHAEKGKRVKDNLVTFVSGLKDEVFSMKRDFREDRGEMARKTKGDLQAFLSEIKKFVSDLGDNVVHMRSGFRNHHAETVGKTTRERIAFVSDLKGTVAGLRQAFAADLAGARRAWSGFSVAERKVTKEKYHDARFRAEEAPKRVAEEKLQAEKKRELEEARSKVEEAKTIAEIIPDDLTEIQGIGPGRQKALNEAGVSTFAQLARSTPEELRRALGESSKLADVENWIRQAKELEK